MDRIKLLLGATALVAVGAVSAMRLAPSVSADVYTTDSGLPPSASVGFFFPGLMLRDTLGVEVDVTEYTTNGQPTLVVIVDDEDCLTCGEYPTELQILSREYPTWDFMLVGLGTNEPALRQYFRQARVTSLIDTDSRISQLMGTSWTPLVILLDSTGRILWVDARPGPRTGQFPFSQVIGGLASLLTNQPSASPAPSIHHNQGVGH